MKDWQLTKLGDCSEIGRGSSPRPINDEAYFYKGTIPWVKIADATASYKYIYEAKEHVNDYGASFSRKLPPGSLIVAASGTLGFAIFLGVEGCVHDGWLYFKDINQKRLDKQFLYYLLNTLTKSFNSFSYGAAIQNINTDILRNTELRLPPVRIQKNIASIISAYDDLIENNRRRIALLEKMAEEIYREWFARLRFPGHERVKVVKGVPEGWDVRPFSEIVSINPVERIDKSEEIPFVGMEDLSVNSMYFTPKESRKGGAGSKFRNHDVLFPRITPSVENGKRGFVMTLADGQVGFGSTEFIVMRNKIIGPEHIYFLTCSSDFRKHAELSMTGASGRQRVQEDAFPFS